MSKIKCHCGHIIGLGEIPFANEYLIMREIDSDKNDIQATYSQRKQLLTCEKCQRIYIYWKGLENEPISYLQENSHQKAPLSAIFNLDKILLMNGLSLFSGVIGLFLMYLFHLPLNFFCCHYCLFTPLSLMFPISYIWLLLK
jgi:hypothetical protein